MLEAQVHRGPDDSGEEFIRFSNGTLGLGHRRLSIIDLSSAGHQPMIHPQTGAHIVFNGEIYNFEVLRKELKNDGVRFTGHSDTEVLLHALVNWGAQCIDCLEGMYAFAFFEPEQQQLVLARDPLGIKPLYTAFVSGNFVFASEVRAIVASGLVSRRISQRAFAEVLAYGAVQEPDTFFEDVRALPSGCYQVLDLKDMFGTRSNGIKRYWDFPVCRDDISEQKAVSEIQDRLNVSVRDHLVSDVPIGVFLSSGLDSTTLAGLAVQHSANIQAFTVGFTDNPDMSEANLARETAKLFGTRHTEVNITYADAERMTQVWLQSMDQPSIDGLNTYIISKAARSEGIIVALSGLGGDELFGGYPSSFFRVPRIARAMHTFGWVPKWMWVMASKLATLGQPKTVVQKAADMVRTDGGLDDLYFCSRRNMSNEQLGVLGLNSKELNLTDNFMPPEVLGQVNMDSDDPVSVISQLESRFYMGNTLLRDSDANGMAHSFEIRVPFLDRRLIDYVFALPGKIRLPSDAANKYLIRRCFNSLFREDLLKQSKRGFSLPIGRWITTGPIRDMCEESLNYLKLLDILRTDGVDIVWRSFVSKPDARRMGQVFSLCVLGLYSKLNKA
jgi:asparagine synthase (glutamine-hydrolysing)